MVVGAGGGPFKLSQDNLDDVAEETNPDGGGKNDIEDPSDQSWNPGSGWS